ncbi:ATP-grasp domain-containing protein [Allofournierella sp.]|uniref:ATP-grasp domain-containing protein n=1 Tax=Allofournierella sp. TaxID=1940256 RepID=UPI003AB18B8D
MRRKLAIIGASYLQEPLIQTAKAMGCETHVFAWRAGDVGEKSADFFYPISIVEKEEILRECRRIGVEGICSIASDLAMLTVNYVAQKMGLVGNSLEATFLSTNKNAMRAAFRAAGDPSPESCLVENAEALEALALAYPLIVKPTDRSGSRGVTLVERPRELRRAFEQALAASFEKKVVVEEFVPGKEYSVECVSWKGTHHFLAVTQKYTTGAPHFIETAHLEPAILTERQIDSIREIVFHALDTLKLQNGVSHSELKLAGDEIKLIEIGGRMGGDCIGSDLVRISTGVDLVRCVVQIALGQAPDLSPKDHGGAAAVRFVCGARDVERLEQLQKQAPETVCFCSPLKPFDHEVTDSAARFGYYILKGRTAEELAALLEE